MREPSDPSLKGVYSTRRGERASLGRKRTSLRGHQMQGFRRPSVSAFVLPTGAAERNIAAATEDDLIDQGNGRAE